jgi:hypothetical protein
LIAQRKAVHRLHDHIGDEEIDAAHACRIFDRFVAACRDRAHRGREGFSGGEERLDDARIIVNDEDSHLFWVEVSILGGAGNSSFSDSG